MTPSTADAEATQDTAGTITSSPAPTPAPSSAMVRLDVPEAAGTQYREPVNAANAEAKRCSKETVPRYGPLIDQRSLARTA
ncbi:hypothetical protein GCM10011289_30380 [Paludibacterium paludis]|uniref:Uncharacterized protein n=1 Tax=Paludibacterium paludis TaxID=1225769 RepID=A0A918P661_9NEIS|nr:hypothetical protein GCM10011289_30380 [Paludibacterium paludis]